MSGDHVDEYKLIIGEACKMCFGHDHSDISIEIAVDEQTVNMMVGPLKQDGKSGSDEESWGKLILQSLCNSIEYLEKEGAPYIRVQKQLPPVPYSV